MRAARRKPLVDLHSSDARGTLDEQIGHQPGTGAELQHVVAEVVVTENPGQKIISDQAAHSALAHNAGVRRSPRPPANWLASVTCSWLTPSMWAAKQAAARLRRACLPDGDDLVRRVYASQDFRDGVRAFGDKRRMAWTGH